MEHAQRATRFVTVWKLHFCLNPYFNGTCSKSLDLDEWFEFYTLCLNPYFNGTCSKSMEKMNVTSKVISLNPYFNGTCSKSYGHQR